MVQMDPEAQAVARPAPTKPPPKPTTPPPAGPAADGKKVDKGGSSKDPNTDAGAIDAELPTTSGQPTTDTIPDTGGQTSPATITNDGIDEAEKAFMSGANARADENKLLVETEVSNPVSTNEVLPYVEPVVDRVEAMIQHQLSTDPTYRGQDPEDVRQRAAGYRGGYCGYGSDAVVWAAEQAGYVHAAAHQLEHVYSDVTGQSVRQSFQHGFSIVQETPESAPVLVDLTVGQFVDPETGNVVQGVYDTGKNIKDYPVLQDLIDQGYVAATPENMAEYAYALSERTDPLYREQLLARFSSDPEFYLKFKKLTPDYDPEEFELYDQQAQEYMQANPPAVSATGTSVSAFSTLPPAVQEALRGTPGFPDTSAVIGPVHTGDLTGAGDTTPGIGDNVLQDPIRGICPNQAATTSRECFVVPGPTLTDPEKAYAAGGGFSLNPQAGSSVFASTLESAQAGARNVNRTLFGTDHVPWEIPAAGGSVVLNYVSQAVSNASGGYTPVIPVVSPEEAAQLPPEVQAAYIYTPVAATGATAVSLMAAGMATAGKFAFDGFMGVLGTAARVITAAAP